jgi:hypothetical protein
VKGKFLLSAVAMLFPVSMMGQILKPATDAPLEFQRYEVFAGADYSGANQAKSSSALIGGNVGVSAKLKRWIGGSADFGYYSFSHGDVKPTVTSFLAGPEVYIPADNLTGFFHVLLGGEHTAGIGAKPDVSFATGVGGGFEYAFNRRLSLRISGDGIFSSFVEDPQNLGNSPHLRVNARASGGVAYHF